MDAHCNLARMQNIAVARSHLPAGWFSILPVLTPPSPSHGGWEKVLLKQNQSLDGMGWSGLGKKKGVFFRCLMNTLISIVKSRNLYVTGKKRMTRFIDQF